MDSVHRFADPAYADLTLRLRAGQEPERLFDRLHALGLVRLHRDVEDAREDIAAAATSAIGDKRSVAVSVATNDEVRALNELIRAQRVARGEVDDTTTVAGSDALPIGRGDVITTRKNDNALGVANRQAWTVQDVGSDGTVWAVENSSPLKHRRSVALPSSYVSEHVHLGYAATAYGVQGVTTTSSHTQLSEALDASGVYVGMTRGRDSNVLHIVAEDLDEAREHFIGALQLDRADRGLQMATIDAQAAVAGLAAEGPVKLVNDERARLVDVIAEAEREAARWERAAGLLSAQAETHAREEAAARDALAVAEARLDLVRSESLLSSGRPSMVRPTSMRTPTSRRVGRVQLGRPAGQARRQSETRSRSGGGPRRSSCGAGPMGQRACYWQAGCHSGRARHMGLRGCAPGRRCRAPRRPWAPAGRASTWSTQANPVAAPRRDRGVGHPDLRPTRCRISPSRQRSAQSPWPRATLAAVRPRCTRRPHPYRVPPPWTSRAAD